MKDNRSALSKSQDILLPEEKRGDRIIDTLKRVIPYLENHLDLVRVKRDRIKCLMSPSEGQQKLDIHDLLKEIRAIVRQYDSITGVHTRHCCKKHGCKYAEDDCPVANGSLEGVKSCEYCAMDEEDKRQEAEET